MDTPTRRSGVVSALVALLVTAAISATLVTVGRNPVPFYAGDRTVGSSTVLPAGWKEVPGVDIFGETPLCPPVTADTWPTTTTPPWPPVICTPPQLIPNVFPDVTPVATLYHLGPGADPTRVTSGETLMVVLHRYQYAPFYDIVTNLARPQLIAENAAMPTIPVGFDAPIADWSDNGRRHAEISRFELDVEGTALQFISASVVDTEQRDVRRLEIVCGATCMEANSDLVRTIVTSWKVAA